MKIGILGGGQLGKMFLQNAHNYPYKFWMLDPSENAPCKNICQHFQVGDFNDYQTVLAFGKQVDVIGIEIEHVNIQALKELEGLGKRVVPSSQTLEIIQDKSLQKQFYKENNIPTAAFYLIENATELNLSKLPYPFVQKMNKGGYDGKGVQIIRSEKDILWNAPSVLEKLTNIDKELAVIVVKNKTEIKNYPVVEMVFNEELNLVEELFSPANIPQELEQKCIEIAQKVVSKFDSDGIYAVELFLTQEQEILVNEIAPRVHNSGHHTIEANYSSQFDAMFRILANLPLGNTQIRETSTMLNVVGEKEHEGKAHFTNVEEITALENVYLHTYGKEMTKPGRKMGHVTVLGERTAKTLQKIEFIKEKLKVISL